MKVSERVSQSPRAISRRTFLVVSGGAVLAACTSGGDTAVEDRPTSTPSPATTPTSAPVVAPPGTEFRVLMPPDSIGDAVLADISRGLGLPVSTEVYVDPAFVLDRLRAQQGEYQYDLVVVPGVFVTQLAAAGLLAEIDRSSIPAADGLVPEVQNLAWDPDDRYSVCKEVGFTGYAWDKQLVPGGVSSWQEFIELAATDELSGKVLALREGAELIAIPSWAEGDVTGAGFAVDEAITETTDLLGPHLLDLDSFPSARMLEGGVAIAQMWSGEGRDLVAADPDRWGYAVGGPVTGGWAEVFVIPSSAPQPELAHRFVDAMLQPMTSLDQAVRRGYNTGVAAIQNDLAEVEGAELFGVDLAADGIDVGEVLTVASPELLETILVDSVATVAAVAAPSTTTTTPDTTTPTTPPSTTASSTTAATPGPSTTTAPQFDDRGRQVLRPQDTGSEVEKLQRRLQELGFSVGRVDGQYGDVTLAAVLGFQRSQGLQTDGVVGRYTWNALENPKPISTTSRGSSTRGVASGANSDAVQHAPTTSGGGPWTKAVVYLDSFKDEFFDANGNLVATFPNSPGVNGLTPTGTFRVYSRSADTYYSKNPAETMKWMVRFNGGIGFHSVPRINGTPEPTPIGQAPSSHGCIRHADDVAKRIYDNLADGATVVVRHG